MKPEVSLANGSQTASSIIVKLQAKHMKKPNVLQHQTILENLQKKKALQIKQA